MQVADLPEESLVGRGIERRVPVIAMPLINLRLQRVPLCEESLVLGAQRSPDIGHALPKMIGVDACTGRDLVDQQRVERLVDLKVGTWIRLDMVQFLLSVGSPERVSRRALCAESCEDVTLLSHYY